jgi:flagellar hook-associated protein 3 FlgL
MTPGDALFARLSVQGFARLSGGIAEAQARIASGRANPRPSADPQRAAELSALRDHLARLDRRDAAATAAAERLALTDAALADAAGAVRGWQQAALRAGNATFTPEGAAALRAETLALRDRLLALANVTDTHGRALFAGTAAGPAYAAAADGPVYVGSDAPPQLQTGDRQVQAAGVTGPAVFGHGAGSLFARLADLAAALREPMLSAQLQATAAGDARLDLARARDGGMVQVTLAGPAGAATLSLDLRADAPGAAVAAINAATADTGVTAALMPDGAGIALSAAGPLTLSAVQDGPRDAPLLTLTPAGGTPVALRPAGLAPDALVAAAAAAVDRLAQVRSEAGALAAAADRARDGIAERRLVLDRAVSGLQDLDMAAEVTRLQVLLTTQQAAQQTYVRIAGQSLFDYLR